MNKLGKKAIAAIIAGSMVFTSFAVSALGAGTITPKANAVAAKDGLSYSAGTLKYEATSDNVQTKYVPSGTPDFSSANGTYVPGELGIFNAAGELKQTTSARTDLFVSTISDQHKFSYREAGSGNAEGEGDVAGLPTGEYFFAWYAPEGLLTSGSNKSELMIIEHQNGTPTTKSDMFYVVQPVQYPVPTIDAPVVGDTYKINYNIPAGTKGTITLLNEDGSEYTGYAPQTGLTGSGTLEGPTVKDGDKVKAQLELFVNLGGVDMFVPMGTGTAPENTVGNDEASVSDPVAAAYNVPANAPKFVKIEGKEAANDGKFYVAPKTGGNYTVELSDNDNAGSLPYKWVYVVESTPSDPIDTSNTGEFKGGFDPSVKEYTVYVTYIDHNPPVTGEYEAIGVKGQATLVVQDKPFVKTNETTYYIKTPEIDPPNGGVTITGTSDAIDADVNITFSSGYGPQTATVQPDGTWELVLPYEDISGTVTATAVVQSIQTGQTSDNWTFKIEKATVGDITVTNWDDTLTDKGSDVYETFKTAKANSGEDILLKVSAQEGEKLKITVVGDSGANFVIDKELPAGTNDIIGGTDKQVVIADPNGVNTPQTLTVTVEYANAKGNSKTITINVLANDLVLAHTNGPDYNAEPNVAIEGTLKSGEKNIEGATVTLYKADGTDMGVSATTDADGKWSITADLSDPNLVGPETIYVEAKYAEKVSNQVKLNVVPAATGNEILFDKTIYETVDDENYYVINTNDLLTEIEFALKDGVGGEEVIVTLVKDSDSGKKVTLEADGTKTDKFIPGDFGQVQWVEGPINFYVRYTSPVYDAQDEMVVILDITAPTIDEVNIAGNTDVNVIDNDDIEITGTASDNGVMVEVWAVVNGDTEKPIAGTIDDSTGMFEIPLASTLKKGDKVVIYVKDIAENKGASEEFVVTEAPHDYITDFNVTTGTKLPDETFVNKNATPSDIIKVQANFDQYLDANVLLKDAAGGKSNPPDALKHDEEVEVNWKNLNSQLGEEGKTVDYTFEVFYLDEDGDDKVYQYWAEEDKDVSEYTLHIDRTAPEITLDARTNDDIEITGTVTDNLSVVDFEDNGLEVEITIEHSSRNDKADITTTGGVPTVTTTYTLKGTVDKDGKFTVALDDPSVDPTDPVLDKLNAGDKITAKVVDFAGNEGTSEEVEVTAVERADIVMTNEYSQRAADGVYTTNDAAKIDVSIEAAPERDIILMVFEDPEDDSTEIKAVTTVVTTDADGKATATIQGSSGTGFLMAGKVYTVVAEYFDLGYDKQDSFEIEFDDQPIDKPVIVSPVTDRAATITITTTEPDEVDHVTVTVTDGTNTQTVETTTYTTGTDADEWSFDVSKITDANLLNEAGKLKAGVKVTVVATGRNGLDSPVSDEVTVVYADVAPIEVIDAGINELRFENGNTYTQVRTPLTVKFKADAWRGKEEIEVKISGGVISGEMTLATTGVTLTEVSDGEYELVVAPENIDFGVDGQTKEYSFTIAYIQPIKDEQTDVVDATTQYFVDCEKPIVEITGSDCTAEDGSPAVTNRSKQVMGKTNPAEIENQDVYVIIADDETDLQTKLDALKAAVEDFVKNKTPIPENLYAGTSKTDDKGEWTVDIESPEDGQLVAAVVVDFAGNVSEPDTEQVKAAEVQTYDLNIDGVKGSLENPYMNLSDEDGKKPELEIFGTGQSGEKVKVTMTGVSTNGSEIKIEEEADVVDGEWSVKFDDNILNMANLYALADGSNPRIEVEYISGVEATSTSKTVAYIMVDNTAPEEGAIDQEIVTNRTTEFSGTSEASVDKFDESAQEDADKIANEIGVDTITLILYAADDADGTNAVELKTAEVADDGTWSITIDEPVKEVGKFIIIKAQDMAGNLSEILDAREIVIDDTDDEDIPSVSDPLEFVDAYNDGAGDAIAEFPNDDTENPDDPYTNDTIYVNNQNVKNVQINGTGQEGEMIKFFFAEEGSTNDDDNIPVTPVGDLGSITYPAGVTMVPAGGKWTVNLPVKSLDPSKETFDFKVAYVEDTDGDGVLDGIRGEIVAKIIIDNEAPEITINTVYDRDDTISGTVYPAPVGDDTITIKLEANGKTYETQIKADSNGSWSIPIDGPLGTEYPESVQYLPEGTVVTATATDRALNESAPATTEVLLSTVESVPTTPIVIKNIIVKGSSATIYGTKASDEAATLTIKNDGSRIAHLLYGEGEFAVTFNNFAAGKYIAVATYDYLADGSAEAEFVVRGVSSGGGGGGGGGGSSYSPIIIENVTNEKNPVVSGKAQANETVEVFMINTKNPINDNKIGDSLGKVKVDKDGNWSIQYPDGMIPIEAGEYKVTARYNVGENTYLGKVSAKFGIDPALGATTSNVSGDDVPFLAIKIDNHKYYIDGKAAVMDSAPFIDANDRTMLPVRVLANAFGISNDDIAWNEETRTATFMRPDGKAVVCTIDSNIIKIGDQEVIIDTCPVIRNDRIYLPMRALFNAFNISNSRIVWDDATRTVVVTKEAKDDLAALKA